MFLKNIKSLTVADIILPDDTQRWLRIRANFAGSVRAQ